MRSHRHSDPSAGRIGSWIQGARWAARPGASRLAKAGQRLSRDAAARLALRETAPPVATAADQVGDGLLGRREVDVARLVAGGLSNKEIGARLFISERTVESHVRSILNKLGFNSRAQIAGWMTASDSAG